MPALAGCSAAPVAVFPGWSEALAAIRALTPKSRMLGSWSPAQVVEHAAQSINYSIDGYPQPKSALFQSTIGSAAFALFDARGRMSHTLSEPIPGAPVLAQAQALEPARERLLASITRFQGHAGALAPHFAYGALDKAAYTRAHLMHLANHWSELAPLEGDSR